MDSNIKVRFAPSPTGPLHIGGARSALFNWLLARKFGGKMIVRIEDTDLERSSRESEQNILAALRWLGLDWDEGIEVGGENGPYRQTERLDTYRKATEKLLAEGHAYYCYCTEEEIEAEREAAMAKGETPKYSGKCRHLTAEDRARLDAEGRKKVVRFKVPEGKNIVVEDLVRGNVVFESDGVGDYVIVKSDGIPVYNFAVVLDDSLMGITHVIRGEEHLSNTPRQLLIYDALGYEPPKFAHVSLILGKDRTKMSKRHGSTSIDAYRNQGYLPEALVNFLALLGWSPEGEEEIFTLEQLINQFSLDRVAKNPAVFDMDKLNHINSHYIKNTPIEKLTDLAIPYLREEGYVVGEIDEQERKQLELVVLSLVDYLSCMADIKDHARVYFNDKIEFENDEAKAVLQDEDIPKVMETFRDKVLQADSLEPDSVKAMLKSITKELGIGGKKVYMPIRVALTGCCHGPELFYMIPILGKDKILVRMKQTVGL